MKDMISRWSKRTFTKKSILEISEITLGVLVMSMGFYFFFEELEIVAGGVTGLSVIFQSYIPSWLFVLVANIFFLILGFFLLGKEFFFKTVYATLLMPIILLIFEKTVSPDVLISQIDENVRYLLSTIMGGVTIGLGLGIVIRKNASTGGMDVLQKIVHRYFKIPFSIALYLTDGLIIVLGMILVSSTNQQSPVEIAVYGIIGMLIIGALVDVLSHNSNREYNIRVTSSNLSNLQETLIKGNYQLDHLGYTSYQLGVETTHEYVISRVSKNHANLLIKMSEKNQLGIQVVKLEKVRR